MRSLENITKSFRMVSSSIEEKDQAPQMTTEEGFSE